MTKRKWTEWKTHIGEEMPVDGYDVVQMQWISLPSLTRHCSTRDAMYFDWGDYADIKLLRYRVRIK